MDNGRQEASELRRHWIETEAPCPAHLIPRFQPPSYFPPSLVPLISTPLFNGHDSCWNVSSWNFCESYALISATRVWRVLQIKLSVQVFVAMKEKGSFKVRTGSQTARWSEESESQPCIINLFNGHKLNVH